MFSAYYVDNRQLFKMTENSKFIKENNEWRYVDGEAVNHEKLPFPGRNDLCPCLSGKKFKICCAI